MVIFGFLFWLLTMMGASLPQDLDVVVYGGTASGVITAVSAAREGVNVALLVPGMHLGGMVSGGLGATDYGKKEVVGGMSLEFFERVGRHYDEPVSWTFEPHVAEQVFKEMVREAGVRVFYAHRLLERRAVRKVGARILEISLENGSVFQAKIFADCSYEGDLMAQAGVSYTWGREAVSTYGESLAGVRPKDAGHMFEVDIRARDNEGRLLPEIGSGSRGELGSADKKVQAYNFRLCLSSDPKNQLAFPKPPKYDPSTFALLSRLIQALTQKEGHPPSMKQLMHISLMPNNKTDVNNNGPFSTDYIGKSWDYPESDYRRRDEIWQDHANYVASFFYFLANDSQVPPELRGEVNRWGLAKDEFVDTNHWPHQLYIREARRMIGTYVMTQKDIQTEITKPDAAGMGSYNSDSHNVQRYVTEEGMVQNEGNMEVPVEPYQIPYRILLPRRAEAFNLLVPVCLSASHVAYSTLRMEPVYMIIGQAAGVGAAMAIKEKVAIHEINTQALAARLRSQGATLEWPPKSPQRAVSSRDSFR